MAGTRMGGIIFSFHLYGVTLFASTSSAMRRRPVNYAYEGRKKYNDHRITATFGLKF